MDKAKPSEIPSRLDHIVIATPDLECTVQRFAEVTGVVPSLGGNHEGIGSRNYLVRFSENSYLEIIGRNPNATVADEVLPFRIGKLERPRIATWAMRPSNINADVAKAKDLRFDFGPVAGLSRELPTGGLLSWTLTQPYPEDSGVVPFLIDWGDSSGHPAESTDREVGLTCFEAWHPSPSTLIPVLKSIGADLVVHQGPLGFRVSLATPLGPISLGNDVVGDW